MQKICFERKLAEKVDSHLFEKGVPKIIKTKGKLKNPNIDIVLAVGAFLLIAFLIIFLFFAVVVT